MDKTRLPFPQRYRINALRALGVLAFGSMAVTATPPGLPFVNMLFEIAGPVAIFVAIAGRAWTLLYIGGRKNAVLVTDGPYSISRNPLYLFSLIGIAGIGAQTGSLLLTVLVLVSAYFAFDIAIRGEEAYLASRFGHRFREYCVSTPRLLPDVSLWRECEDIPLRSARSLGSFRDGIVFVTAWIGVELIKVGQAYGLLPVILTLPM